jgi:hypothetical protein
MLLTGVAFPQQSRRSSRGLGHTGDLKKIVVNRMLGERGRINHLSESPGLCASGTRREKGRSGGRCGLSKDRRLAGDLPVWSVLIASVR